MDNGQFWPRIGENVIWTRTGDSYRIVDLVNDYPCRRYVLRNPRTGETVRAYRHELDKEKENVQVLENESFVTETFVQYVPDMDIGDFLEAMSDEEKGASGSDLDDDQLNDIQSSVNPKSTSRSTDWAMRKFKDWQLKRKININLATATTIELGTVLRKLYAEVRTNAGKRLSPISLRGVRAGLQRHLTSPPLNRQINMLTGEDFTVCNKMFESQCKLYVQLNNPKPRHHVSIEEGDIDKIKVYLSPQNTPVVLQHAMWFMLCYNFARRGQEGWKQLTKETFTVKIDDKGNEYLTTVTTEATTNWQGGSSSTSWDYGDVRAYGDPTDPLNVVNIYKKYVTKLNPQNNALFQRPKKNVTSDGVWYDNMPLGKNTLATVMKQISKNAKLSVVYTNHCVSATAITIMYQAGIDTKQICNVSKHKSEESLKHYIKGSTSEQKRMCSNALQKGLITVY